MIKIRKSILRLLLSAAVFLLVVLMMHSAPAAAGEVKISAAASLTDVLNDIASEFRKTNPSSTVRFNFGSSGALAKQIMNGAPVDVFISANDVWINTLVNQKKIDKNSVKILAKNTLVFVGPKGSPATTMAGLASLSRIAIGSPKSVPAGEYAVQAMKKTGIYDSLVKQNKLVLAQDVRQALMYADRGEADGAFVYRTDALLAKKAVVLFTVQNNLHDAITYPLALTGDGEKNESAKAFVRFLSSPASSALLKKYGFIVP